MYTKLSLEPFGVHVAENKMAMEFQVCGVKKALAAVHKICRVGNVVQFGSEEDECFIKNKKSGKKVMLRRKGGSYVMDVEFVQDVEGNCYYEDDVCGGDYGGLRGGGIGVPSGMGSRVWDAGGGRMAEDEACECGGRGDTTYWE